jgi:RNA polymerase sigma factor (sigma-70 family)
MTTRSESLLHYLRHLTANPENDASDAVLLERFASHGDESAFTALLARHGPMVLGVCRRILRDGHAAEDAFQATFLVLARKAGVLHRPQALAAWLYGTAHHLASTARRAETRRHQREARHPEHATSSSPGDPLDDLSARELLLALDEELARLPESYRLPLILCHLEGHSYEEAARLLGWTAGSVKGRLERGRKQLQARLIRRGLALGASLLAMECMATTTVSAALRQATMQRALTFAAGSTEGIATNVLTLVEAGVASVTMTKAKLGLILLLALGLACGSGVLALPLSSEKQAEEQLAEVTNPEQETETPKPASDKRALTDLYGDPLPSGAVARMGTMRWRHMGSVISVVYSPDGKTIATSEINEGPLVLWDAATGKELHRLEEEPGVRGGVAFSPDGKQLAWAKEGSWVGLWDVATGKQLRRLKGRARMAGGCVAFSSDGKTLANSLGNFVTLFDVRTGAERRRLEGHPDAMIASIAFSADGKVLAAGGWDKTIVLWDTTTAKILHRLDAHEKQVPCVAFSDDGKTLASASHDRTARLWDVASGQEQRRFVHEHKHNDDAIQTVHFVPGHPWLVTGGLRSIRVWDLATSKEVRRLPGHFCLCGCPVSLSSDGTKLATHGQEQGQIVVWELATGKRLSPTRGHQRAIGSVAFSPDGKTLATGSWDETLRLWDAANGKEQRSFRLTFGVQVTFIPDGKTLAAGSDNGVVHTWDAATGKELRRFSTHKGGLGHLVFAADGKTCISTGVNRLDIASDRNTSTSTSDKLIRRWRVDTGTEIGRFEGLEQAATRLALAPDGRTMVSVSPDKTARLWDVSSGKEMRQFRGQEGWLGCVTYSPDGKTVAAAGEDRIIRVWDITTSEEVRRFVGHTNFIEAVHFAPDGRTLASASHDRTVRLWEVATGQERHRFLGHRNSVFALAFSHDGQRLASAGYDAVGLVWDVTGRITAAQEGETRLSETELNQLWMNLGKENAAEAYRAMRTLLRDPRATMRLFQEKLRPVPAIDRAKSAQWIADLDSTEFAVREKAVRELEQQGEGAEGALRKVLEGSPSLEVRQRVKSLLEKLTGANRLRSLRAVEVLEHLDTVQSRRLLETLAVGAAEARLTEDAKASLRRLTVQARLKP